MKSYVFKSKLGVCKVRFYATGAYTIVGFDGVEHEIGEWQRRQQVYMKNGREVESKDKNACYFTWAKFGEYERSSCFMRDMAKYIAEEYCRYKRYNNS